MTPQIPDELSPRIEQSPFAILASRQHLDVSSTDIHNQYVHTRMAKQPA